MSIFDFLMVGLDIPLLISNGRFLVNISIPSCFDFFGEAKIGRFSAAVRDFMGDLGDGGCLEAIISLIIEAKMEKVLSAVIDKVD